MYVVLRRRGLPMVFGGISAVFFIATAILEEAGRARPALALLAPPDVRAGTAAGVVAVTLALRQPKRKAGAGAEEAAKKRR